MSREKKDFLNSESLMEKMFQQNFHGKKTGERSHDSLLDEAEKEVFDRRLDEYIKEAAKQTQHDELLKDNKRFEYVRATVKKNVKEWAHTGELTPLDLANISLLGVLSAYVTGAQRIYIQAGTRIRNDYAAPNFNMYANENYAFISEAKQIDFAYGDSLGLEKQAVMRLLRRGDILEGLEVEFAQAGFIKTQEENKKQQEKQEGAKSPFGTPKLMPPIQHIYDDGEGD